MSGARLLSRLKRGKDGAATLEFALIAVGVSPADV